MLRSDDPTNVERAAPRAAVVPRLTDEFLETATLAAIAMDGEDQAAGIAFTLAPSRWPASCRRNLADSPSAIYRVFIAWPVCAQFRGLA